jgi:hypothetical protein
VYISPPTVTWTGSAGTNWNTAANWSTAAVPLSDFNIIIPDVVNDPVLDQNRTIGNLTIQSGGQLSMNGFTATVTGTLSNSGTVSGTGRISMAGSSAQTITGTGTLSNLEINNNSGVSISSGSNMQSLTGALMPTAGILTTNGNLTLKSSIAATAMVTRGSESGGYVSGNVSVERYIPAGRKWRLLSAPLTGSSNNSIFYNWQNNDAVSGTTGVTIWGPGGSSSPSAGNGLAYGVAGSMRRYDNGWSDVTSTMSSKLFEANTNEGYALFVTGPYDRGNGNITNGQSAATTLTATGQLITGTHTRNLSPVVTNQFFLVGNPFASPVDPQALSGTNINNNLWMWDAKEAGNNSLGRYVSFSRSTGLYSINSAGYPDSAVRIQSGQAFFVQASAASAATVVFEEADKHISGSSGMLGNSIRDYALMRISLMTDNSGTPLESDGAVAIFYENGNPGLDEMDGSKLMNTAENIYMRRKGRSLTFEHRPHVTTTDTLFIGTGNLQNRSYRLAFEGNNFTGPQMQATLIDRFTQVRTPLQLNGKTAYEFNMVSDPAMTGDRFMVVLNRVAVPVQLISVAPRQKGRGVELEWGMADEWGVSKYALEKAAETDEFREIHTSDAGSPSKRYDFTDTEPFAGLNRYRVKAVFSDGSIRYSETESIRMMDPSRAMTLYPNPVKDKLVVWVNGDDTGPYSVRILDSEGRSVWQRRGLASKVQRIELEVGILPPGTYNLTLTDTNGRNITAGFVKE